MTLRDHHWEHTDLKSIAQQACDAAGLTLRYLAPENPTYGERDHVQESDIAFLSRLARKRV